MACIIYSMPVCVKTFNQQLIINCDRNFDKCIPFYGQFGIKQTDVSNAQMVVKNYRLTVALLMGNIYLLTG